MTLQLTHKHKVIANSKQVEEMMVNNVECLGKEYEVNPIGIFIRWVIKSLFAAVYSRSGMTSNKIFNITHRNSTEP